MLKPSPQHEETISWSPMPDTIDHFAAESDVLSHHDFQEHHAPAQHDYQTPSISVIIPTKNEAGNLPYVLPRIPAAVGEVILVDGASTDDTVHVARVLRPDIRIIRQTGHGKGDALLEGFRVARGDLIVMMDADGSTDPAEIPRFIEALCNGADVAKGSRFIVGGGSDDITHWRKFGNDFLCCIVNVLFGASYSDLCYGFNAFRRSSLEQIMVQSSGFEIETLLTLQFCKARLHIAEVPSHEHSRIHGISKLNPIRDGLRILRTILAERFTPALPAPHRLYTYTERVDYLDVE